MPTGCPSKYSKRPDRWKNMTDAQRKLQNERRKRWKYKNPERMLLMNIRNRAKAKGIPFNLDISDIKIPEYCPVLGIKLEATKDGPPSSRSPSIDKIIPALGYVKGNVIVISYRANVIKTNATPDEILRVGEFFKRLIEEQVTPV